MAGTAGEHSRPRERWALRSAGAWPAAMMLAVALGAGPAAVSGEPGTAPGVEQVDLFTGGEQGYATFRIPALLVARSGAVVAFCEGRRHGRGDTGDIDLVLRRSLDGGKTWGPLQPVADDGSNTVGNPCPVLDRDSGTIWLLLTRNLGEDTEEQIRRRTAKGSRSVWLTRSGDEGRTWSAPVDITASVKRPDWTWYATGPGVGVQLRSGRLVIPCDHNLAGTLARRSHVILSDDRGRSWRIGGVLDESTNECQVAERHDGSLLLNMRSYHGMNRRAVATSGDGGENWSPVTLDPALVEPVCQAALLRLDDGGDRGKTRLLFSNPASTKRERLTVRLSRDGGASWPAALVLSPGPSAYSSLAVLPGGDAACLYERGDRSPYERVTFARFPMESLAPIAAAPAGP